MTGAPRATVIEQIVEAVVDALDAEPMFAEPASLDMLARQTERHLDVPLQIPQLSFRRQRLLAFVTECSAVDGGLVALASAVGRMDGRGRVYRAVDLLVRTGGQPTAPGGPGRQYPSTGPASPMLTQGETAALADVYSDAADARGLLERAGFPRRHHPRLARSSETFWTEVNQLVAAGAFPDGRALILRAASVDFPANPWFSAG